MEAEQKHRITVEFTDFEWKMLQAACAYDGMSVEEFVKAHTKLAVASALEAAGKKISRGYSSWTFVHDCLDLLKNGGDMEIRVLYMGDHDPSGLDIERFTYEAMRYFGVTFELKRVALTYDQVKTYNLLPNPTKKADPRARHYISKYGDECWELDALEPRLLQTIVRGAVEAEVDKSTWDFVERLNFEARQKAIEALRRRWDDAVH